MKLTTLLRPGGGWCPPPRLDHVDRQSGLCLFTVAAGDNARELLEITGQTHADYANRIGAKYCVITNDTVSEFPIGNKWHLAEASSYDKNIYLDADVIVRQSCPDMSDWSTAMHDDFPHLPDRNWCGPEKRSVLNSQGLQTTKPDRCFNTGVVVYDNPRIWDPPTRPYPHVHCAEQHLVEGRADDLGIEIMALQWRFNVQWWWSDFRARVDAAHIVHLANAPHLERMSLVRDLCRC